MPASERRRSKRQCGWRTSPPPWVRTAMERSQMYQPLCSCVFRANICNLRNEVSISQYSLSAPNEETETHIYAYSCLFKQKFKTHTPINLTELTLRSLLLRLEGLEFKFTAISRCLSCVLGVTLSQGGCLSQTAPSGQFLSFLGLHL